MDRATRQDVLNYLQAPDRVVAALASVNFDGSPRAATIYYFVDNDFNFYFLTAAHTQKYNNLTRNPDASIAIGFGPGYTCVQGEGTVELLEKGSEAEGLAIAHVKERMQTFAETTTWPIFQLEDFLTESIA